MRKERGLEWQIARAVRRAEKRDEQDRKAAEKFASRKDGRRHLHMFEMNNANIIEPAGLVVSEGRTFTANGGVRVCDGLSLGASTGSA